MKVYVFGNQDLSDDNQATKIAEELDLPGVEFVYIKPNQDLPVNEDEKLVVLDTVEGIDEVTLFDGTDLDSITLSPRTSVHDYDMGFQLKYLNKLGKLGNVKIVSFAIYSPI